MNLPSTPIQLKYDDHNHMCFCDRVHFENEDVFDTITDVDCIVEVREETDEFEITLHDLRCFNMEQEEIEVDEQTENRIHKMIHRVIYLVK